MPHVASRSRGGPPSLLERFYHCYRSYFSNSPARDGVIYGFLMLLLVSYAIISVIGPFIAPACDKPAPDLPFKNPDYNPDPCLTTRFVELGGITLRECWFIRCIISSMILGSVIGYERRSPDRAAGIRSMSLTALGACCFTIAGNYACQTGPMNWDASRISAAIPSGVGFLGAGIIWKGYVKQEDGSPDIHQVHGLTTAASIWLSAAIGTACGGGLYPAACFTVTGIVLMLRFGPRNSEMVAEEEDGEPGGSSDSDEGAELAEAADMFRGGPETSSLSSSLLGRRSDEFPRATSSAVRRLGRTESKKSTFSHT
mmetsp:Transcript_38243/g.96135  ORF Transcript_38243/g.96135 Transcript_38243/m.96135 type:complete len:313 (+) Transcript_38243:135-1073(+)